MILFPHAKINLGLNVVRKRPDGYHDIETVFLPIPLRDVLEAVVMKDVAPGEVLYSRSGLPVEGEPEADLVMRAHRLIAGCRVLPGLRMHLHKAIPLGAGLGGGSSDATHTLLLLDRLLELHLSQEELRSMAMKLGSDCAYFLEKGPRSANGRGEMLAPLALDLTGCWTVVVNPGIHVPTSEVFKHVVFIDGETGYPQDLSTAPIEAWNRIAPNALEEFVFRKWPAIREVCDVLKTSGAAYAAMSGSGSTVYGIYTSRPPALEWPAHYRSWSFLMD